MIGSQELFWIKQIRREYMRASEPHGRFNTSHEGYAVLLEEVDELWDAIKNNYAPQILAAEAVQIAAMALRFLVDVCSEGVK